ncbi:MAG: phosphonopyruvate decarboxylase [Roseiflexaceae bacterium]
MTRPSDPIVAESDQPWAHEIYAVFKQQAIALVSFVPDAGHRRLIELCRRDPALATVALTTEEEGVALAAGAYLGGRRSALLMQSSGVGNCVNMFSLLKTCRIPFLTIITMRGEWAEFNPWQIPMGQATPAALTMMGLIVYRVAEPAAVRPTVEAAARLAFASYAAVAVLLGQQMLGAKSFDDTKGAEP